MKLLAILQFDAVKWKRQNVCFFAYKDHIIIL